MQYWMAAGLMLAMGVRGQEIRLTQVAAGIAAPTDIENAGDGSGRIFLVQQDGTVRILRGGAVSSQPFLDIRAKTHAGGERGLLGLAFPAGFAQNQRFYVDYTDLNGDTIIAQYRVSSNVDVADAASEVVLLKIAQPFANHNGGQVRFGPDGYLYTGMGDGGGAGDPMGNGQNRGVLLGKLLRIDVESAPGSVRIPPDNPLVNVSGARPEIWAFGLRNPWRFSFDRASGDLWIGDVGQDTYEEIDFQAAGAGGGQNYGWNLMEGTHCYQSNCSPQGLTLPVVEYQHTQGCSVTGGFVYRGSTSPGMRGLYLYADYCSGRIWGIERQGRVWANRLVLASGLSITTFGEDEVGELYLADAAGSAIYHIEGSMAPRLSAAGVVNAASFAPGLTPGSLSTVFAAGVLDQPGTVLATGIPIAGALQGVSVTVNGIAAPVQLIANRNGQEQVNFQAPFEIGGSSAARLVVTRDGRSSAPASVAVSAIQPGVYLSDGVSAVVVHNSDYSLVTTERPLAAGEFAFLYAAGLGAVSNQPATGAGAPVSPLARVLANVGVALAGVPCEVQFAGLAPGLVGVYQVNFRVPANAPAGSQELVLTAAGVSSPAVKVSVQ